MTGKQYSEIGRIIEQNASELAERSAAEQYRRHPELNDRYGDSGYQKSVRDAGYTLQYMAESFRSGAVFLLSDYIAWCRITLPHYGVDAADFDENIHIISAEVSAVLPENSAQSMHDFLTEALRLADNAHHKAADSYILPGAPLGELAAGYTQHLLRGDRHAAMRLVEEASAGGTPVRDIYEYIFQPSQKEIGRLWQLNRISVAQEHYCTAATQFIMSRLYPKIFSTPRKDRTLIAACVNGELHELGIRMVADYFELDGWDTFYLGANTPLESIADMVKTHGADAVAVSATMTIHVNFVETLVARLRQLKTERQFKVIVGGYPFNIVPDLWQKIGADGYAPNARIAVDFLNTVVGGD